jgi:hypothetical protein
MKCLPGESVELEAFTCVDQPYPGFKEHNNNVRLVDFFPEYIGPSETDRKAFADASQRSKPNQETHWYHFSQQ